MHSASWYALWSDISSKYFTSLNRSFWSFVLNSLLSTWSHYSCLRLSVMDLGESWSKEQLTKHAEGGKGTKAITVRSLGGHAHNQQAQTYPVRPNFLLFSYSSSSLSSWLLALTNNSSPVFTICIWLQAPEAAASLGARTSTQAAVSIHSP